MPPCPAVAWWGFLEPFVGQDGVGVCRHGRRVCLRRRGWWVVPTHEFRCAVAPLPPPHRHGAHPPAHPPAPWPRSPYSLRRCVMMMRRAATCLCARGWGASARAGVCGVPRLSLGWGVSGGWRAVYRGRAHTLAPSLVFCFAQLSDHAREQLTLLFNLLDANKDGELVRGPWLGARAGLLATRQWGGGGSEFGPQGCHADPPAARAIPPQELPIWGTPGVGLRAAGAGDLREGPPLEPRRVHPMPK